MIVTDVVEVARQCWGEDEGYLGNQNDTIFRSLITTSAKTLFQIMLPSDCLDGHIFGGTPFNPLHHLTKIENTNEEGVRERVTSLTCACSSACRISRLRV